MTCIDQSTYMAKYDYRILIEISKIFLILKLELVEEQKLLLIVRLESILSCNIYSKINLSRNFEVIF